MWLVMASVNLLLVGLALGLVGLPYGLWLAIANFGGGVGSCPPPYAMYSLIFTMQYINSCKETALPPLAPACRYITV